MVAAPVSGGRSDQPICEHLAKGQLGSGRRNRALRITEPKTEYVGNWLSLVERPVRDREAAGSNPAFPTSHQVPFLLDFSRLLAGARSPSSPDDFERLVAFRTVTKYGEIVVERSNSFEAEALEHDEARTVDDREVLVRELLADSEGHLQVCDADRRDGGSSGSNRLPESLGDVELEAARDQAPGLDEDVVAEDEAFVASEDGLRSGVGSVAAIDCGVERRRVDIQRQRSAPNASPMYRSLCRAISEPPESPRSKIAVMSAGRGDSPRSHAIRRRTYSANEMPSSFARARARR